MSSFFSALRSFVRNTVYYLFGFGCELLGGDLVLLHEAHEVLLLFGSLETSVTVFRRGVDELQRDLLEGHSFRLSDQRFAQSDRPLARAHHAALEHDEVLSDLTVLREATHWGDLLLDGIEVSLGVGLVGSRSNSVDLLVDLCAMMVALLTGTCHCKRHTRRMPSSNTGHLAQTLVSLARQLGGVPTRGDTLVTASLGHTDHVDHLVLAEDLVDRDLLLQMVASEFDFVGDGASVQLDFHDMGLLLSFLQQLHLSVSDYTNDLAVLDDLAEVALDLFLARFVLPLLGVLGERLLLLRLVPSISFPTQTSLLRFCFVLFCFVVSLAERRLVR